MTMRAVAIAAVTLAWLLAGVGLTVAQAPAGKAKVLADRHVSTGLACDSCHGATRPVDVPAATCVSCHGPYAELMKKTAKQVRNPHDSHYPDLECTTCHRGHQPLENFCATCHGS